MQFRPRSPQSLRVDVVAVELRVLDVGVGVCTTTVEVQDVKLLGPTLQYVNVEVVVTVVTGRTVVSCE